MNMLSAETLRKAADLREQIDGLEAQLDGLFDGSNIAQTPTEATIKTRVPRRRMSDSARKRIAKAQRERWARVHAAQGK